MTDQTNNTAKNTPDLYIYTKRPGKYGKSDLGSRIGVGFYHKDGQGFNMILDAQPIPFEGRIELVGFPPKDK